MVRRLVGFDQEQVAGRQLDVVAEGEDPPISAPHRVHRSLDPRGQVPDGQGDVRARRHRGLGHDAATTQVVLRVGRVGASPSTRGAQSAITATPTIVTASPVGAKSRKRKPVPRASRSALLTIRFAGVPTSVQRPPSSVANDSGITRARGADAGAAGQAEGRRQDEGEGTDVVHDRGDAGADGAERDDHSPRGGEPRAEPVAERGEHVAPLERLDDQQNLDDGDDRLVRQAGEGAPDRHDAEENAAGEPGERDDLDAKPVEREHHQKRNQQPRDRELIERQPARRASGRDRDADALG